MENEEDLLDALREIRAIAEHGDLNTKDKILAIHKAADDALFRYEVRKKREEAYEASVRG